jgi:hypothetical protein
MVVVIQWEKSGLPDNQNKLFIDGKKKSEYRV